VKRISDTPFVVLDVESTGLSYADGDRIVEFAAKRYPEGDELSMLVNPGRDIPVTSSAIHSLVDADVVDALKLEDAYTEIGQFVGPRDIAVAHNAVFDTTMLPCLAGRRTLCTKRLAQHLLYNAPAYSNAVLRYHLGGAKLDLRGIPPHRALADVLVTSFIFGKLLDAYFALGHPDDIDALLALAASPIRYTHMPFGKYRNCVIADIDTRYLQWALSPRGLSDLDADLRTSLVAELANRNRRAVPA